MIFFNRHQLSIRYPRQYGISLENADICISPWNTLFHFSNFFSGIFTIYKYSRVIEIMALSPPDSKLKGRLLPSGNLNLSLNNFNFIASNKLKSIIKT
jgi:hypothetical protein